MISQTSWCGYHHMWLVGELQGLSNHICQAQIGHRHFTEL